MKRILSIFLATILLSTGCSSNSEEDTNSVSIGSETQISNKLTEPTIEYKDIQAYLEESGENLVNYLKKSNIDYKSSSMKTRIISKDESYEQYGKEYDQFLDYYVNLDYHEENKVSTKLEIKRSSHGDDKFDFNNPYIKLIYKVIKSQDKKISESKFKKLIDDYINGDGDSCIFENESLSVNMGFENVDVYISLSYFNELNIENKIELTKEYETVKAFKDRENELNLTDGGWTEDKYLDDNEVIYGDYLATKGSYMRAEYEAKTYGDLEENYTFLLGISRDEASEEVKIYPSDKKYLSEFIEYMTEVTEIDISQYMTVEQLYKEIEDIVTSSAMYGENILITDSHTPIGSLNLHASYDTLHEIRINITIPVVAEGKTRL